MACLCFLCFQVPVEVPYSLGVNLAVEGASLRPPRACRQHVLTSLSHSHLSSQQLRKLHRSSSVESSKVSDSCRSGKERKSKKKRGSKKRQTASAAPERGQEQSAEDQKTSCTFGSLRQAVYEGPLGKSKRNSQTLGFSASKAALIPLNFSLSLTPRHSALQSQRKPGHRSHISGSIQLQTAIHHPNRTSVRLHPPLRLPLPSLEVLPFPLM